MVKPPILLLTPTFPPDRGGLGLAVQRLALGLAEHLPLEILVIRRGQPQRLTSQAHELTVLEVQAPSHAKALQLSFEVLRERAPHRLVHAVYPSLTGFLGAYYAGYCDIPLLVSARGNDLWRDAFRPEYQSGVVTALQHADLVVGVSNELCRMATALGARATRWIANGVDSNRFQPQTEVGALRESLGLVGVSPVIGFFGEAREKKGLHVMLDALVRLRKVAPAIRLLLVGGVREDCRTFVTHWRKQTPDRHDLLVELPWVDHQVLNPVYGLTDVVWHPALRDGLPNAVLEAMACARPLIASAAGGTADIAAGSALQDWVLSRVDGMTLAMYTQRLLALDHVERQRLGMAYRAHVVERFPVCAEIDAYLAAYTDLVPC